MAYITSENSGTARDGTVTSDTSNVTHGAKPLGAQESPQIRSKGALIEPPELGEDERAFVTLVLNKSQSSPELIHDVVNLSNAELHKKYSAEYESWRAMRRRVKDGKRSIHWTFETFGNFLLVMGRKTYRADTLDRSNNDNLEYSPTNARWASKRTQANNRSTTLVFTDPDTRKTFAASDLDKKHKLADGTTRQRRNRGGWSDAELIAGKRLQSPIADGHKPVTTLGPIWMAAFAKAYPGQFFHLNSFSLKKLGEFEKNCPPGHAPEILEWAIENWDEVRWLAESFGLFFQIGDGSARFNAPLPRLMHDWINAVINAWMSANDLTYKDGVFKPKTDPDAIQKLSDKM